MRTVIAITAIVGLALIAPTSASAIPGTAGGADAAAAQYTAPSSGPIVPEDDQSVTPVSGTNPSSEVEPSAGTVPGGTDPAFTPAAPVSEPTPLASGEGLPFTGYAVMVVLGFGLMMLMAGVALRRSTALQRR